MNGTQFKFALTLAVIIAGLLVAFYIFKVQPQEKILKEMGDALNEIKGNKNAKQSKSATTSSEAVASKPKDAEKTI